MATGVIAEFNPFHNGHKYLLEKAHDDNGVIAVMSGSFVQRGDIAICDKWTRAKAALLNGADLVLELPVIYSLNTAQKFAMGAVATLASTGIVDTLTFGTEIDDTEALISASRLISDEPCEVSDKIRNLMAQGMSYPAARETAFSGLIKDGILSSPNSILAVEYLRAAYEMGYEVKPKPVMRHGTEHDSDVMSKCIASASTLRSILKDNGNISDYVPYTDFNIYSPKRLDTAILYRMRTITADELSNINDVTEGLENRFISAALNSDTLDELCLAVKSKRYPLSRIRRIVWSALLGLNKGLASVMPQYIRVLGMNEKGKELLKDMKKSAALPIITKAADFKNNEIFEFNHRAEDIFALCAPEKKLRQGGSDIRTAPVIL